MGASMSAPTPISQNPSDIAYEFLGAAPAATGKVTGKAAPASHSHALGTIQRAVTGFGLAQEILGTGDVNRCGWLVTDIGALQALPIWTLEGWGGKPPGINYNSGVGFGFFEQGTAAATPNPASPYPVVGYQAFGVASGAGVSVAVDGVVVGSYSPGAGWVHNALTYDGFTLKAYLNGVLQFSVATTKAAIPAGWLAGIGGPMAGTASAWVDECRISNTVRYAGNFAPPTAPFLADSATVALWHFDDTPLGPWVNLSGSPSGFFPNPTIPPGTGWAWTPAVTQDSSGNGISLGLAARMYTNAFGWDAFAVNAALAKISPEDSIGASYNVTSLENQTGDLSLVTPAGAPAITAITPQADGTTQLTIAAGGGGVGDPAVWLIPPVA